MSISKLNVPAVKKTDLIRLLRELAKNDYDPEAEHYTADMLLLDYIDDDEIRDAFLSVHRWYG